MCLQSEKTKGGERLSFEDDFNKFGIKIEKEFNKKADEWEKKINNMNFNVTGSVSDGIKRIRSLDIKYDPDARKDLTKVVAGVVIGASGSYVLAHFLGDYIQLGSKVLSDLTGLLIEAIESNSEIKLGWISFENIYYATIASIPLTAAVLKSLVNVGKQWKKRSLLYEDKFRRIRLYGSNKVDRIDEGGSVESVYMAPRLLKEKYVDADTVVRIFSTASVSINDWKAKLDEIDQEFNWNIYKLELSKMRTSVIMVIVSDVKAHELRKRYKIQQDLDNKFEKIGLHAKGTREIEYFGRIVKTKNLPEYLGDRKGNNEKVTIKSFKLEGSELQIWKENKYAIENILETNVVNIELAEKSKQIFEVLTVKEPLKSLYDIKDDRYFPTKEGELILGEGLLGLVKSNLKSTPHILIAGVTDSGKSVLFELLIWQMILQGHYIIPIDFKGGVNMRKFEEFGPVTSTYKRTAELLKDVKRELKARLAIFKKHNVENMYQYHDLVSEDEKLSRVIVCVDELAEIMDRSGVKKKGANEEEDDEFDQATIELLDEIEGYLSTIARLGRAVGIHLIAATQRPDAKVITGQIKNNMSLRISGKMTDVQPSMMVLGSNAAVNLKAIKGRFVMTTGSDPIRFQAPYFKREHIKPGYYRNGRLIVLEDEVIPSDDFEEPAEEFEDDIYEDKDESSDFEDSQTEFEEDENDGDDEIYEEVIDLNEWDAEDEEDKENDESGSESKYNF